MIKTSLLLLLLLATTAVVHATATPLGTIEGTLRYPDDTPLMNTTKIALNDGERITYSKPDGSFVFYKVPPGIHLLDVHSYKFNFGQVKIQLLEDTMDAPKCIEYPYPGAPKQVLKHPLQLKAHAYFQYFEEKKGFSPTSILKNPMMLMMLVSVAMMLLMPKMMENLDPEEREKMQQQMQAQQDPMKMLSNLMGGGVAEEASKQKKIKK
eukprot:CAMPEP_0119010714 /NCGR_PEP_ID=MMETSP1176-20130426/5194_1 /TAXON_ID=265551 /ORGANISM="Synedropsis recta cf, Strain CCMP1620" /LENGTH=208 /DNA_ID=CAMNT_0006963427 /DNA_START=68 /DNA_END=694 /DNA_ORIENTATION=+